MKITSNAFKEGELIPVEYTCDGKNISPPLKWKNSSTETKSFAIICEDPDAPIGIFVHWIIFNIPAHLTELEEDIPNKKVLANGAKQGINNFRKIGYSGPCPPGATHRYFFKIYALDTVLDLKPGIEKSKLLDAMKGHILDRTELMGKYSR